VLDFENTAEDIEKGFQPFYGRVTLSKETNANQLTNIRTDLEKFAIHEAADLEAFANGIIGVVSKHSIFLPHPCRHSSWMVVLLGSLLDRCKINSWNS